MMDKAPVMLGCSLRGDLTPLAAPKGAFFVFVTAASRGMNSSFALPHAHSIEIKSCPDQHVFVCVQFMDEMTQPALPPLALARSHGKDESLVIVNLIFHSICLITSTSGRKATSLHLEPLRRVDWLLFWTSHEQLCASQRIHRLKIA